MTKLPGTAGLDHEGAGTKKHALLLHVSFNFVAACLGSVAKKISCVIMVSSRKFCRAGICRLRAREGGGQIEIMYEEEIR